MIRLEVHTGEGGADASAFAGELAMAIAKHSTQPARNVGGTWTIDRL